LLILRKGVSKLIGSQGAREKKSEQCVETANKLIQAVYKSDDEQLMELLSEDSRLGLRNKKISMDKGLPSVAEAICVAWNCPQDRVLVLGADIDHPHLKGRVRVPVILDPRGSIPEGYVLPEGSPLPCSCGSVCVLLIEENGEWKIDNITDLEKKNPG